MPGASQQAEYGAEGILDYDAVPQDDRQDQRRRHPVSLTDPGRGTGVARAAGQAGTVR